MVVKWKILVRDAALFLLFYEKIRKRDVIYGCSLRYLEHDSEVDKEFSERPSKKASPQNGGFITFQSYLELHFSKSECFHFS